MTEIRFTPDGISSSYQVNVTSSNFAVISSDNVTPELQFVDLLENTSAFDRIVVIDENDRVFHSKNLILNNISASGFISASTLYVENSAFFQNGLTGSITGSNATFNQGIFNAITSSAISTSYIDLDPLVNGNAPPHREGRIFYSSEDGALTVYNNEEDISLQVGQEFYIRVRNETGVTIEDGTPIKISGSQGDTPLAHLAVAEDITQFYANPNDRELFQNHIIGLATHRIEHNTTGYATELGIVRGVDTTQFQSGDELYVSSSAGELTNIPPEFPYEIIQVGTVVRSANNGFIFVNIKEPVNFGNISGYSGSYEAHLGELWVYQPNGSWTHTRYVPQLTSSIISVSNIYATNIFDINSESGSSGQLLSSTPTGIDWIDITSISGSISGSGTTNYLSKWKSSSELTRSVVYEDTNGNLGVGITTPTHVIEVSSSNQNLLNLNDVLYVSGSHLNGTGSGLVNIGTDKDLDVTVNIGKNIASNVGSAILNLYSYYSPEIHLSAHNNWSNWTIEGGVNKDLKIYDQGSNRRDVVVIGTLTYPTALVMTKTDPCFEVEINGGNGRSLSIGQTFVGNTQRYDTYLRTSNGASTYESFLFKHSGEIVASGSFIGSNVDVSGSTSNFHGDVKITGSLYLTGSLYDKNNTNGSTGQLLSSTTDGVDWIDATSIDGFISGSGTANYLSKWKSSSELTRSVIYEDVNGNIGIGTTSPSELFNIVGNSLLEGDLTVTGQSIFLSASYINLTSSNVNIGDNILTLNAFSPFKRYAGIEMNDSGSSAVAQFLWDSELDYFFISGSTATNSQNLVIVGPDSNESLSTGYLTLATDINQLSSSVISQNNDGNIGIGTPNPTHSLDVVGGIKTDQLYDKNNTSGSNGQLLSSTTSGVDWIDATSIDGFISGSGTTNYIPIWKSSSELSSSNIYQLNSNVGIGVTSPTRELEIMGDGNVYTRISSSISNDTTLELYSGCNSWSIVNEGSTSGDLKFRHQGLTKVTISSSNGNVGIGTTNTGNHKLKVIGETHSTHFITGEDWLAKTGGLHIGNDGLATGAVSFYNSVDGGGSANIYRDSDILYVGARSGVNTRGLAIDIDGDLGIGTTSPSEKLTIEGSISSSGDLYLDGGLYDTNNEIGTSGQLLSSTGNAVDWIDATEVDGFISGSGTTNYIPIWKSSSELSSSNIYQLNGNVGIGTTGPDALLELSSSTAQSLLNINKGDLYVSGSGNVGIGTTGPDHELEVAGSSDATIRITSTSTNISDDARIGTLQYFSSDLSSNTVVGEIVSRTPVSNFGNIFDMAFSTYAVSSGALSEKMRITGAGKVGIGTTSPASSLHIANLSSPAIITLERTDTTVFGGNSIGYINFRGGESTIADVASIEVWSQETWNPDDSPTYMSFNTTPNASTTKVEAMRIDMDGNVGIGTTSPSEKLTIEGSISASGDLYLDGGLYDTNNEIGLSGQLLSSTGTAVDWIDNPGVSGTGENNKVAFWTGADTLSNNSNFHWDDGNERLGIGTTSPESCLQTTQISFSTQTCFTQGINFSGLLIDTTYDANHYTPGLFWRTNNNEATKPKAGIYLKNSVAGSCMLFGTSNDYSVGITNDAVLINPLGNVGIGTTSPSEKLTIEGSISSSGDLYLDGGIYDTNNEIGTSGQLLSSTGTAVDWIDATDIDGFISGSGTTNYIPIWKSSSELSSSNIYQLNGDVGIGTTSPSGNLEIWESTVNTPASLKLTGDPDAGANTEYANIIFHSRDSITGANGGEAQIRAYRGGDRDAPYLNFDLADTVGVLQQVMTIHGQNNAVGIGTDSPSEKLTVNGNISGSGMVLTAGAFAGVSNKFHLSSDYNPNVSKDSLAVISVADNSTFNNSGGIAALHVINNGNRGNKGNSSGSDLLRLEFNDSIHTIFNKDGNVGIGTTGPTALLELSSSTAESLLNINKGDLYVSGSGNVGIGTASPSKKLEVVDSAAAQILAKGWGPDSAGNDGGAIQLGEEAAFHGLFSYDNATSILYIDNAYNSSAGDIRFRTKTSGTAITAVTIEGDGNVGIGTTEPEALLELSSSTAQSLLNINKGDLYVSSSGDVGIGTTNPIYKLDVVETGGVASSRIRSTNANVARLFLSNTVGTWRLYSAAASNSFRIFSDSLNDDTFVIDSSGNVGIGTTSPIGKLEVIPDLTVLDLSSQANGSVSISNNSNGAVATAIAGKSTLGLGIYAGTPDTNTSGDMVFHVREDDNTDFSTLSNPAFQFRRYATNLMTILRDGNVGIGITNPTHSLNVVGGIKTDQLYDKNNTSGSDGQILSSTTTGIDWIDTSEIDGFVSGSGTATYLPLWTDTTTLSSSIVFQQADGNVGVNTTTPAYELEVSGGFAATEKHFVVQDPTNPKKRLVHSSLEGPENAVYFRGISNKKVIELPEYWRWLVNSDTITVHLTPVKKYQKLYFSKYENNKIYINNSLVDKLKFNKLNYHYIIYAERKDVNKLKVYVAK